MSSSAYRPADERDSLTMGWIEPVSLHGRHVRLEPLSPAHDAGLRAAVADGELWRLWYTNIPDPDGMPAEIERRLALQAQGSMLPFTVLDAANTIVGMTTFMNIDATHHRVEIGSTWYRKSVQRTALNTECKLLLLRHAFQTLECIAVEFRTHFFNAPSRRAIERLGAKFDGVLRNHQRDRHGLMRDTCVYSIIDAEWPVVRHNMEWQLAQRNR
jgi:RimJ/RimL family protein N-acetyltransferase